jgi:bacterioferritin (cytochrome b1)
MMNLDDIQGCSLENIPYPEVRVTEENIDYAKILSCSFAGDESEVSLGMDYFYFYFLLSRENPELAKIMLCFAYDEVLHTQLMGHTVALLGGDPKIGYNNNYGFFYWTGEFGNYQKNVRRMIVDGIKGEEAMINQYEAAKETIKDPYIHETIDRIILDNLEHMRILQGELAKVLNS